MILLKRLQAENSDLIGGKEIKFTEAQNKLYELLEKNKRLGSVNKIMPIMLEEYQCESPINLANVKAEDRLNVLETLKNNATNARQLNALTLSIRRKYKALPISIMKHYIRPAATETEQAFKQSYIFKYETAETIERLFNKALSELNHSQKVIN